MNAIEVRNLTKKYGKNHVLRGLNLKIPKGSVYGFLGNNGAGKTTTFSILGGFVKQNTGSFEIDGKMTLLPQDARFYADRSILSQMKLFARLSGMPSREAEKQVWEVLEKVGLKDKAKSRPDKLSHGMGKRLATAQALLGNPEIILLDEPLAGLDPQNAFEMKKLIQDLSKDKTLVISSHILADITELCDRVGIIHDGVTKFEGDLNELTQKKANVSYLLANSLEQKIRDNLQRKFVINYHEKENKLNLQFDVNSISLTEVNATVMSLLLKNEVGILEVTSGESLEAEFLKMVA